MENIGYPTPDGTEGIVHVKLPNGTNGIGTDDLIGCIINYQKLGIRDSSCYGLYKCMLLLPVNSTNNKKYENRNIKDMKATFYNFKEKKQQTLEFEKVSVEPEKLTHQFLPCCMEEKEKRDKRTLKVPKSESEKAQSYVSKYSKTVGIDILKSREFCKQGNQLFGICKSDKTSRAKFVTLKISNEAGVLVKYSESDDLHPCGILLHGKGPVEGKYDVEVIGSYTVVNDRITYKLIYEADIGGNSSLAGGGENPSTGDSKEGREKLPKKNYPKQDEHDNRPDEGSPSDEKKPLDDEKPSSIQKEVPIGAGATLSDRGNLQLDGEGEIKFPSEAKGEGGVVPSKNKGKNTVKPATAENASKKVTHKTKVPIIQHDSSEKEVSNKDVNKYAASSFSDHSSCSDVDSSSSPVDKVSKLHKIREDIESQQDEVKKRNLLDTKMTEVKDIVTTIKEDGKCQNSTDVLKELEKWEKLVAEAKKDWSDTCNALKEREESHLLLDKRPFYDVGQQDLARKIIDNRCAHLLLFIDNQLPKTEPLSEYDVPDGV